uniref:AMP-dependent synthetase/ligase domain-containing protein n=1 Tax=Megaselia scalaris TaxID=36166 RepID=T1H3L9_MEGSC
MFVDRGNQELFYKPSQISSGNQTAVILCSSGSTGPPKAVTISHNVMKTIGSNFSGTCEEVSLSFTSLFWISGLNNMISTAMTGATRLVSCEPFNAELCLELIDKYKATKATFLPMHLAAINASPARFTKSMKSLNIIFSSGAPLPCETLNNFKEILSPNCRIIQGFACTEKGAITMDLYGKADGSCGTVAPNVEVKIIDNNGHSLGPNENGEIVARNFHP